jgi:23S rRNA (cytosine1962-C5)-methyltransferase
VRTAAHLRSDVLRLGERTNAWRLIHAEGDGLSGLVVDRYGTTGSLALFSLGWQKRLAELKTVLAEEAGLEDLVVRADAKAATHEGLSVPEPQVREELEIHEDGLRLTVDPAGGHKTGYFLDQRENRRRLARLARGLTVFDGMTYTGGFALAAARAGAASVRAMDLDEVAIERAERNARLNGLAVDFQHGDVFDALRAYGAGPEEKRPDVVVVDPPKWARDRSGLGVAIGRYRDLNRLALLAVKPGGILCTSSCSGLVGVKAFHDVVRDAALDTRRDVRILYEGGAGPDHPVSAVVPESRYLKCLILAVGPNGSGPGGGERERPERKPRAPRGPRRM